MTVKTKSIIGIALLGLADIVVPLPVLGFILIYVILQKPAWFIAIVEDIYSK